MEHTVSLILNTDAKDYFFFSDKRSTLLSMYLFDQLSEAGLSIYYMLEIRGSYHIIHTLAISR